MYVTRLQLQNWRNFRDVDVRLREHTYLLGANASGKSNLLDVFRFLRDVAKSHGGGLQQAIVDRGGIKKLRCLHARRNPEVRIRVELSEDADSVSPAWTYVLAFNPEGKGAHRTLITAEQVWKGCRKVLDRPDGGDRKDDSRRTQTHLEQIQMNAEFREIATLFARTTYLHLVPQLLKYRERIGGMQMEGDPFGQGFLDRVARTQRRTRDARLGRIENALTLAVPQFKELQFAKDVASGRPHLQARYAHHRPNAGWQREEQFSDGTLRLIGLLWSLLESDSLLLLEEPELSLNDAIVREIPLLFERVGRDKSGRIRLRRQLVVSTHSEALLSNTGIDGRGVLVLEPGAEGSTIRPLNESESNALQCGFSVAEAVLPKTYPAGMTKLGLQ